MIYEYRRYVAAPGRMSDLLNRFREHTLKAFERNGFRVVGFWQPMIGNSSELHYMVAWEDLGERQRCWTTFRADPEWVRALTETEARGSLTTASYNEIWTPTDFSPLN